MRSLWRTDEADKVTPPEEYTAGFLFWKNDVLLVIKNHPEWQRGLINAIGGRVEPGETGMDCMSREFREETGIDVSCWMFLADESGPGYRVQFYHHHLTGSEPRPVPPGSNDRGEVLGWVDTRLLLIGRLSSDVVGNLRWLIPMAQDWRRPRARVVSNADIRERPSW